MPSGMITNNSTERAYLMVNELTCKYMHAGVILWSHLCDWI